MVSVYIKASVAYLIGFFIALKMPFGFGALFSLCLVISVFALRLDFAKKFCACMLMLGVLLMSNAYYPPADGAAALVGHYTEIEGVICEMPDAHDDGYYSYIIVPKSVRCLGKEYKMNTKLRVTSSLRADCANKVRLRGFLDVPSEPGNSSEFNYALYLKSRGVRYNLHSEELEIVSDRAFLPSASYALEYVKSRLGFGIDRFFSGDDAAFLKAVLLGHKTDFSHETKKLLYSTGAMRFMHPAYLHIFLITALCEAIFAFLPRRKRTNVAMLILTAVAICESGYTALVRAVLIYTGTALYRRVRGFSHYTDIGFSALTLLLIANPLLIFNPGPVIAACAGLVIYIFDTPLSKRLGFIKNRELRRNVSVWICGTLGVMPVSAYYFGGASLYSIIFMLLYTPLTIILIILAPIVLLIYEIFSKSLILGYFLDGVIAVMRAIPKITAELPGCSITLAKPSPTALAALGLLAAAVKLRFEGHTYRLRYGVCCTVCAVLIGVMGVKSALSYGNLEAYFVNVGQGDGAVISIKGRDKILLDGGGNSNEESNYNIGEEVYVPYLAARGFNNIDLAIATHYHIDHCEGIIAAMETLKVGTLMLPQAEDKGGLRKMLEETARKNGTEILYVSAGDRLEFKSGLVIYVLSPYAEKVYKNENDISLALRLEYRGRSLFFGGDMTSEAEETILSRVGRCDILKVAHHGSAGSSSEELLDEISPGTAVISVGENNVYSHPADKTLERLKRRGVRILRTDKNGDIKLTVGRGGKITAESFREGDM